MARHTLSWPDKLWNWLRRSPVLGSKDRVTPPGEGPALTHRHADEPCDRGNSVWMSGGTNVGCRCHRSQRPRPLTGRSARWVLTILALIPTTGGAFDGFGSMYRLKTATTPSLPREARAAPGAYLDEPVGSTQPSRDAATCAAGDADESSSVELPEQQPDRFDRLFHAVSILEPSPADPPGKTLLGQVGTPNPASWKLAIDCNAIELDGLQFDIGQPNIDGDNVRWPICINGDSDKNPRSRGGAPSAFNRAEPVAELVASSGSLAIALSTNIDHKLTDQLQNCMLVFVTGATHHTIQLRQPVQVEPLVLDLKHVSESVDFPLAPAPRPAVCLAELAFEVSDAAELIQLPEQRQLELNGEVRIKLTRWEGAEIRLRLIVLNRQLRFKAVPCYTLQSQKYPLNPEAIVRELAVRMDQQIRNCHEMSIAKKRLAKIPSDIRKVSRFKPRTLAEKGIRSMNLAVLDREAAKLQARIHRLAATIPRLAQNITRLKELLPMARKLEHCVTIAVRLVAQTKHGNIELAVTRS